jgi:hypothetical protein
MTSDICLSTEKDRELGFVDGGTQRCGEFFTQLAEVDLTIQFRVSRWLSKRTAPGSTLARFSIAGIAKPRRLAIKVAKALVARKRQSLPASVRKDPNSLLR